MRNLKAETQSHSAALENLPLPPWRKSMRMPAIVKIVMRRLLSSIFIGSLIVDSAAAAPAAGCSPSDPATPLKRLLVLDFKLTGDAGGENFAAAHRQRLAMAGAKLRAELKNKHLYEVVDEPAATALIAEQGKQQNLHQCNGCELDLAKQLNAEQVLVPWIFRMSNLVLTLHVEIRDAASGRISMKKALDFRGDNDSGWLHAIGYLVKDLQQQRPNCWR